MGEVVETASFGELAQAVASGDLRLEEGVAERCVAACDELIAELDAVDAQIRSEQWEPKFGDFAAGKVLAARFRDLAVGEGNSLLTALESHVQVVQQMRDLFESAGRAYREAEEANAARIAAAGDSLSPNPRS